MAKQKLFTKSIDDMLFAQYKFNSNFEKQKVACKIFNPYGDGTWYILNSDPDDPDYLWAIVQMFGNVEVGSVSRSELESISFFGMNLGLERDISFEPISALEVYEGLLAGKHYAKGGGIRDFEPKEFDKPRGKTIYYVEDEDDDGEDFVQGYDNYDEAKSAHSRSKLKGYQMRWHTELETKKPPYVYESGVVLSDGRLLVTRRRGVEVNEYAKGGRMSEVQWANDENKKLGIWLLTSVDGNKILRMSKNAKELEKNVMNYYNKKGSVARMIYDENASEGLSWVVFEELFQEIQSVYAKGGETGDFDWEALSYNQKLSLVRESGLMDSVALKSVGTITPVEMSKLKNSVRLNRELQTGKFEYGGELDMTKFNGAGMFAYGGEINKDDMIDEPYRVVVSDKVADKLELYLDKYNINYEFVHNTNVGDLNVSVYDIMPNSEISHRYFDAILSRFMYGFEGIYPSISDYTYEDEYAKGGTIESELKEALRIAQGSIFSRDFLDKYEIVKEVYSSKKYANPSEMAKNRKKELQTQGFSVKIKKVDFSDLARAESYFITAVKRKFAKGGELDMTKYNGAGMFSDGGEMELGKIVARWQGYNIYDKGKNQNYEARYYMRDKIIHPPYEVGAIVGNGKTIEGTIRDYIENYNYPFKGEITYIDLRKKYKPSKITDSMNFADGGELTLFDDFMRAFREDYDDMDNYLAAFSSLEEAKQFAINNKNKYGVIVFLDAYGDSIWVDKNDTKEDIDFLFSTEYAKGGEINKDDMIDEPYRVVVSDKVADKLELYLDKYNINYEFVHNTNVGGLNVSVYDIMPNSEISHRYFDAILSRFMYGFEGIYPSISDYTYEDEYAKGGETQYGTWSISIEEDENDDDVRNEEVARLIKEGYTRGFYPTWHLEISNIDGDLDKVSQEHIAELVKQGFTNGEVIINEYAKGGRITTNDEIIEAFLRSERTARINNLYIYPKDNEMVLVNYRTIIARRMGNKVYVTTRKYSVTTSKIQSKIRSTAMRLGLDLIEVDDITTLSPPKLPEPRKRGERKAATPKPQSSFFSEFAKGGKIKKSKDKQYMKDVDVYKYFIVNLQTQKVESGWEHKSDAIEALSNYDGDANYKVVSERGLKLHGISNPKKEWKKFADGGRVYGAGIFKEGGINDGHNVDLEATKKLILNMPKEDILTFVQNVSSDVKTQDQAIAWVNSMTQDIANNIWIKLYLVHKYNPNYGFYEDGGELNFNEDVNGGVVVYTGGSRIDRKGLESIFSKFPITYKRIDVIRVPNLSKEEVEIIAAFLQQYGGFYGGIEEQPTRVSDDEVKESLYTINLSATIGKNYTPQEVLNATMAVLSMFSNEIGKVSFYIIKYLSAFHANNLQSALTPYNLFIDTRIQLPENWYKFAKGGKIGFKALSEKVAKRYAGKKVQSKYQSEYGKSYSKEEAREVGNKVAAKVYRQQLAKRK